VPLGRVDHRERGPYPPGQRGKRAVLGPALVQPI
jgi:hypothetical protein